MMRTLALAVGVCLLTGASSAATNGDDEGPDPTPPSAVLVQDELLLDTDAARTEAEALAAAWGVPVDTAHRWRQTQFALDDAAVAAESAAGGRYAGAWIEWRPEPHLVVELTHGRQVAAIATAFRNVGSNAEVRYTARYSNAELVDMVNGTGNRAVRDLGVAATSGIDPTNNRLVFGIAPGAQADAHRRNLSAELTRQGVPHVVEIEAAPVPANRDGRYTRNCTSGFTVKSPTGLLGYTVAAHCPDADQDYLWYSQLNAGTPWRPTSFVKEAIATDVQWHAMQPTMPNGQATEALFQVNTTTARRPQAVGSYLVGDVVFNWGSRSRNAYLSFGTIKAVSQDPGNICGDAPHTSDCGSTFVRVEGPANQLRACVGDSGGPIFSQYMAVGTLTHANVVDATGCTPSSGTSRIWFAPVQTMQTALGVHLWLGD